MYKLLKQTQMELFAGSGESLVVCPLSDQAMHLALGASFPFLQ